MDRVAFDWGCRTVALGPVALAATLALTVTPAAARHAHHPKAAAHHRAARAAYSPPYAAIVVDANSGKVLHEASADGPRHPASLTKIMTLYLLFERLESGKLTLRSELPVSAHAAAQAPSKLGLRPGQTIAVEDAIRAVVTKSANDVAVVIAEALGGTESDFARMMTAKARALGMNHTLYRNASGLPNPEQITTARDMALLGRAIQDRFPKYYRYFSTPSFAYKGDVMRNHNHLLASMEGIDGIKTGYVEASGFNLVASYWRGGRHLVAVVMGGHTANARDARMRELLTSYVVSASPVRTAALITEKPVAMAAAPMPSPKPAVAGDASAAPTVVASADESVSTEEPEQGDAADTSTAQDAGPAIPAKVATKTGPDVPATASASGGGGPGTGSDTIEPIRVKTVKVKAAMVPFVAIPGAKSQTATAAPASADAKADARTAAPTVVAKAEAPAPAPAVARSAMSEWMIQVGALETEKDAAERIANARAKAARFLARAKSFTEPIVKADMKLWRARFSGISKEDAEAACKTLKSAKIVCITLKN